jgi:hypothetical protein
MKTHHKSTANGLAFSMVFNSASTRILLLQMTVPLRDGKSSNTWWSVLMA